MIKQGSLEWFNRGDSPEGDAAVDEFEKEVKRESVWPENPWLIETLQPFLMRVGDPAAWQRSRDIVRVFGRISGEGGSVIVTWTEVQD